MDNENTELDDKDIFSDNNIEDLDEILNLLNQVTSEEPDNSDIQAISDLLNSVDNSSSINEDISQNGISDVGDIFSDALKSVSDIKLSQDEQEDLLNLKDGELEEEIKDGKKEKKSFLSRIFRKKDSKNKDNDKISKNNELVANIEGVDNSLEATDQSSEKPKKKKKIKESKIKNKVEAADNKEKTKVKKSKTQKDKVKNAKKEKKPKKVKEVKKVAAEEEVDTGKINPVGATLVFAVCTILLLSFLFKGRQFSYSLNIDNANKYFNNQEYTKAFNEVYGLEIKDEDAATYNKIITVMYVKKQLDSYENYYALEKYPEALESLLKGLQRYDKYIELATLIGIEEDLNYVKDTIVAELNNVFNLSEVEAKQILNSADQDSQEMYIAKINEIASNRSDKN